ncbi:MAG: 3'-5' exonuclease, partial [Gammaproteobacteria bacterium]|nr:3'-5' exonuclease [Gammaproteobacteria bacterium]
KVWSLGDANSSEEDLLQRFYDGIERFSPTLVSWNGNGFDLPVIHYRSLLYPVNAGCYWSTGGVENNDYSRFAHKHTDLMDVLSGHQVQASVGLAEIATLCGFPGNMCFQDNQVWKTWLAGDMDVIRDTAETRVLNTYLVYLNWQRNLGHIDQQQYVKQCQQVRDLLKNSSKAHFIEFEKSWIDL